MWDVPRPTTNLQLASRLQRLVVCIVRLHKERLQGGSQEGELDVLFPPLGRRNKKSSLFQSLNLILATHAREDFSHWPYGKSKKGVRVHSYYWERRRGSGNQLHSYKNQSRHSVLDTYKQRIYEVNSDGSEACLESSAQVKAYGHRQLCFVPISRVVEYA